MRRTLLPSQFLGRRKYEINLRKEGPLEALDGRRMGAREAANFFGQVIDRHRFAHGSHGARVQRVVPPKDAAVALHAVRPEANPPPLDRELHSKQPRETVPEVKQGEWG